MLTGCVILSLCYVLFSCALLQYALLNVKSAYKRGRARQNVDMFSAHSERNGGLSKTASYFSATHPFPRTEMRRVCSNKSHSMLSALLA